MKSAFAYFGGKMTLAPMIVGLMPAHDVYVEPYFGSGAVLFAKPRSRFEIVNDRDLALVTFWKMLRERPDELAAVCALSPHSRVEFDAADLGDVTVADLEIARRVWVRVNQSFSKNLGPSDGWGMSSKMHRSVPATALSRLGRFAPVAERLATVTIECCDAIDLVRRSTTPSTVMYVDPPYLAETRAARGGSGYRHEASDVDHHERLAEALTASSAQIILSGYRSSLYDRLYSDWVAIEQSMPTFSSNQRGKRRSRRTERLWMNFEPPAQQLRIAGGGVAVMRCSRSNCRAA